MSLLWLLTVVSITEMALASGPVTCGSVVKLVNRAFDVRLHSPDVKYGMGSGQRSVTGVNSQIETGSNWQVKSNSSTHCRRGAVIECGSVVRLENLEARMNLHSHVNFEAPISSGELEVSVFGEGGVGDSGDDWELICSDDFWSQDNDVMFRHVHSRGYLAATGREYGDPISGQIEVVAARKSSSRTKWRTAEGVFIKTAEMESWSPEPTPPEHDEL